MEGKMKVNMTTTFVFPDDRDRLDTLLKANDIKKCLEEIRNECIYRTMGRERAYSSETVAFANNLLEIIEEYVHF
jgi:hypothetical protein